MRDLKTLFLFTLVAVLASSADPVRYDGDKVFRIEVKSEADVSFVHGLLQTTWAKIDVWKTPQQASEAFEVHVPVKNISSIEHTLKKAGLKYTVFVNDLQETIDTLELENKPNKFLGGKFNYEAYNSYKDIINELHQINQNNMDRTRLFHVGISSEGRQLLGIKVFDPSTKYNKEAIWIDGGMHSREWISPATVLYLVRELLYPSEKNITSQVKKFLSKYDIYILPLFNVDGYVYTRIDRFCAKTRSYDKKSGCYGVNPNLNWDFRFGEGKLVSSDPCSIAYNGPYAFSEPETKAVAETVQRIHAAQGVRSYWNIHSYGQLFIYPWAYKRDPVPNIHDVKRIAGLFLETIKKRYGTVYTSGPPTITPLNTTFGGACIDWAYGKIGTKYAFAPELRPTVESPFTGKGFLISPKYIRPTALEFIDAFLATNLAM